MTEQTLSDTAQRFHLDYDFYCETDVKDFIKKLKEEILFGESHSFEEIQAITKHIKIIDKLAGEKLI